MAASWGDRLNLQFIRTHMLSSIPRHKLFTGRIAQAVVLLFVAFTVLVGFKHLSKQSSYGIELPTVVDSSSTNKDGNATLLALAPAYIKAIMDPTDKTFDRAGCPKLKPGRAQFDLSLDSERKYFFALDLYQNAPILPRLLGSVIEAMEYLGPQKCSLSIVEGRSTDGTFEILKLLRRDIERIGATYHFVSSDLNPGVGERIEVLAELRNLALAPLLRSSDLDTTTVIFLNDVAICSEDILELVHQRFQQGADMTCALDWTYVGKDPTFYDVWIARGMTGDSFFEIPADGNWNSAWNIFWNDGKAQSRLNNRQPFQVFSCWNGAVAFSGQVLKKVKFRASTKDECHQGEPKLFCKDMWHNGFGKIAVIPSVNIVYDNESMRKIKELKGFMSDREPVAEGLQIEWEEKPPEKVKCMLTYDNQIWVPWNEALT